MFAQSIPPYPSLISDENIIIRLDFGDGFLFPRKHFFTGLENSLVYFLPTSPQKPLVQLESFMKLL